MKATPIKLFEQSNNKQCLNCNETVSGRFCGNCVQENIEHKEDFWHLLVHFFNDITHFDSKLFGSLKLLIMAPNKLTQLFLNGKHKSYLDPIKMYAFINKI